MLILFPGTICCMYGCCPSGTVCNAVGGCDSPDTTPQSQTSESVSESGPAPSSCETTSIITSQTTITDRQVNTVFVTVTFVESCTVETTTSSTSSSSSSLPSGFNTTSTQSTSRPSGFNTTSTQSNSPLSGFNTTSTQSTSPRSGFNTTSAGTSFPATTWTEPDGATVVSSSSMLIINGSLTIPISPVSAATTFTTDGETFTLLPSSSILTGSATTWTEPDGQVVVSRSSLLIIGGSETMTIPSVTEPTTLVTDGETFTFFPSTTSSSGVSPLTTVEPDGQTVISSSGILIIGTNTVTLPSISSPTTLTTDGETFALFPPTTSSSGVSPLTTVEPDGQTVISSSGILIIGANTVTLPSISSPTTLTTDGETFTLLPQSSNSPGSSGPITTTLPDGQTLVSSSGVLIIGGSETVTLPTVSSESVLTTDGETFTLLPPTTSPTSLPNVLTTTLPDGQTLVSSSGVLIIGGSETVTLPSITKPTTLTTDGETFTLLPPTSVSDSSPVTTTLPDGQTVVSSSGLIIIGGSETITVPTGLTGPTTVTTDGETFTFQPTGQAQTTSASTFVPCVDPPVAACVPCPIATRGCWPTSQVPCTVPPIFLCTPCLLATQGCWPTGGTSVPTTTSSSTTTTPLPIFTTWPPGATIEPVTTTVNGGGGGKSTCKLWFFFVS